MPEEQGADQHHDQQLLDQFFREVGDRAIDQPRAVVHGDHLHAVRQAAAQCGQACLDRCDHLAGITAVTHDHDSADRFALAVEIGDAPARRRSEAQVGDVAQQDRATLDEHPGRGRAERIQRLHESDSAHRVFGLGDLDDPTAGLAIAVAQRGNQPIEGDAVGLEPDRIDDRLVATDEAADRGDFGDARKLLQLEAQEPVLQ